ncbi:MAG: hypothetical protein WBG50_26140 [Desulfomonilaceae bacterium]
MPKRGLRLGLEDYNDIVRHHYIIRNHLTWATVDKGIAVEDGAKGV